MLRGRDGQDPGGQVIIGFGVIAIYLIIAAVIAGVRREFGKWSEDDQLFAAAWGPLLLANVGNAIAWALMWLGRGPVRLARLIRRTRRRYRKRHPDSDASPVDALPTAKIRGSK